MFYEENILGFQKNNVSITLVCSLLTQEMRMDPV